jgi:CheY-like chemotaxis protein
METKFALVVDDSKSARFALRKFLENQGYTVETAEGALEAYTCLKNRRPDVVFLDHLMPGIDGFDALRTIRREPEYARIPVIICSSNEGDDFVREARAQGASEILPKPPTPEHIERVLKRVRQAAAAPAAPQATPAPASATHTAAPSPKVQPIREPEVAIQQAVMKTLREAMPASPLGTAATASAGPPAAPTAPTAPRTPAAAADTHSLESMREDFEGRMRRITQDLYVQFGAVRAQLAHIEGSMSVNSDERIGSIAGDAVKAQMKTLSNQLESMFANLRGDIEAAINVQNRNIEAIAKSVRQAAAEEAHTVAERVVMNAAVRISDQMAESFLRVLRQAQNQAHAA